MKSKKCGGLGGKKTHAPIGKNGLDGPKWVGEPGAKGE